MMTTLTPAVSPLISEIRTLHAVAKSGRPTPSEVRDAMLKTRFTDAVAAHADAMTVLAASSAEGPIGVVVNACSQVSAELPTLLVCVDRRSPVCAAMTAEGRFAVNLLNSAQPEVARTARVVPINRLSTGMPFDIDHCGWMLGQQGTPMIEGALATFECMVGHQHTIDSHTIFLGRIVAVESVTPSARPYSLSFT